MRHPKCLSLSILSLVMMCTSLGYAQTAGTGAVTGTVTDSTGAAIPGVTVEVTNADTGQQRTVLTGEVGTYIAPLLPPGSYRLKFSLDGFTSQILQVTVRVTETPVVDAHLEVGTQTQEVTVESAVDAIQTTNAALGGLMAGSQVASLPLTTRNYTNLLALSAGVSAGVTNASNLGKAGMDMAVNGGGTGSNNTLMDGVSITNFASTGTNSIDFQNRGGQATPNPDTLQEFKVQTSAYDASYGRNAGANVSIVTKSGTNTFHGSAFEFFRNTALNANDFFLNLAGKGKGILNQNQYGGTLGGPIKKDKLFFFGAFQGTRQKNGVASQGNSAVTLVPLPADRSNTAAFRSFLGSTFCPGNHPGDNRYTTFRGGVQVACDGSNISPVAVNLLQAKLPDGSYYVPSSTTGSFQNTNFSIPAIYREDQYMGNVDWLPSSVHTVSARYFIGHNPSALSFANAGQLPGDIVHYTGDNTTALVRLTSVLSPTFINEARVSFQRNTNVANGDMQYTNSQFGITALNPLFDPKGFLTTIVITGAFRIGGPSTGMDFFKAFSNSYQFADQISWTHGKHSVKAGWEHKRTQWNYDYYGLGKGNVMFSSIADFLVGRAGCTPGDTTCSAANPGNTNGTAFSNVASTTQAGVLSNAGLPHAFRITDLSGFVNDDFKVTSRLTVNLGVRWEFNGLMLDKYGNQTNFWPSAILKTPRPPSSPANGTLQGYVVPANYQGELLPGLTKSDKSDGTPNGPPLDNFAPRFGFAWQPAGNKFVIRGGYGWFYERVSGGDLGNYVAAPPYGTRVDTSGTNNYFSTLAAPFKSIPYHSYPSRWVDFATEQSSNLFQLGITDDFHNPVLRLQSLSVQYQLLPATVVEAAYVGSRGVHQWAQHGINQAQLASPSNPINGVTTNTITNVTLRVPYLGYGTGSNLARWETNSDTRYNSLQMTVRQQASRGLTFQGAYTWSKALSNASQLSDMNNPAVNYGPNGAYRPQRFVLSGTWQLPFGQPSGFLGKLAQGWSLSDVTTIQSGTPMTITDSRGGTIYGLSSSTAQLCPGMTYEDMVTSGDIKTRLGGTAGGQGYFNKAAFCNIPAIGNGTGFGNTGVGIVLGPGQFNFDTAVSKSTLVGGLNEAARLEFRAEFFNMLNHAQFSNPVTTNGNATFGQITGTSVNSRLIQFALKYVF